ncbi:MAG: hypothetical protein J5944_05230 [Lentisphaeria bacterium]|nr:hypothetical protein [Lentisphaeria bacterium]
MKRLKITMLGAGSGFVLTIARELLHDPVFADCEFTLMDIAQDRLAVKVPERVRKAVIVTKMKRGGDHADPQVTAGQNLVSQESDSTLRNGTSGPFFAVSSNSLSFKF